MANQEEIRQKSLARRNKYKELLDFGSTIGLCFEICNFFIFDFALRSLFIFSFFNSTEASTENDHPVQTLKKITDLASRSDDLNAEGRHQDRLENTTEVVMDAQVLKVAHELLGSVVQNMDNTEISDDEFIGAIVSHI